jgi:hypothetical protein
VLHDEPRHDQNQTEWPEKTQDCARAELLRGTGLSVIVGSRARSVKTAAT